VAANLSRVYKNQKRNQTLMKEIPFRTTPIFFFSPVAAVSHATDVSSIHAASWVSLPTSNLEAPFVVTTGSDGIVKAMSLRPPRRGLCTAGIC
jgi:hypothetical protein